MSLLALPDILGVRAEVHFEVALVLWVQFFLFWFWSQFPP